MEGGGDPGDLASLLLLLERGAITAKAAGAKVKEWLDRRQFGIVPSPDEYEELKRIGKKTEYEDISAYASGNQKKVIRLGLRLRELEGDQPRVDELKAVIRRQFDQDGLYLAQVVQSRAGVSIRHTLSESGVTESDLEHVMVDFLRNPRRYVLLVSREMEGNEKVEAQSAHTLIREHFPQVFAIAGSGMAQEQAHAIAQHLNDLVPPDYEWRKIEGEMKILFLLVRPPLSM